MTGDEAAREPQVEFLIDYWDGCPECGMQDGDCHLDEGGAHHAGSVIRSMLGERVTIIYTPDVWWYCDIHRTRWSMGNPFSSRPVYGERRKQVLGYRIVEPVHDPVWNDCEALRRDPEALEKGVGRDPCKVPGDHAVRRPALPHHDEGEGDRGVEGPGWDEAGRRGEAQSLSAQDRGRAGGGSTA